jgi:hypothetical protein
VTIYRIRQVDCPDCDHRFRVRCRVVGDTEIAPSCPECGYDPHLSRLRLQAAHPGTRPTRLVVVPTKLALNE